MTDTLDAMIDDLFVEPKKKTPRKIREATSEELERATKAVNKALEAKSLMTYGKFWSYVTQQPRSGYKPTETAFVIKLADQVQPGASALLVNRSGKYGKKAPAEDHINYLKENEFPAGAIDLVRG